VWRSGFMRCRSREGPWGSHQLEASALKCDTSVGSTVPVCVEAEGLWRVEGVVEKHRVAIAGATRRAEGLGIVAVLGGWERHRCTERAALAGL
jgi:hypothetical protein